MSYILDALRRAEAEREQERGEVPALHAHNPLTPAAEPAAAPLAQPWLWIVAGGAVGVLVPFAIYVLTRDAPPVTTPAVPAAEAPRPAAVTPPATTAATADTLAPVATAPPVREPERAAAAAAPARPTADTVKPTDAKPTTPANTAPTQPAAATPPRAVQFADLPDDVRRGLPALSMTGTMYSQIPANRMVIINGTLYREGDAIGGAILDEIRPKSVVLRHRDTRYELAY
jgi:general secretion pathway protein B